MNKDIIKILSELGVPMHLKGYNYLIDAVEICIENPTISITKELYVDIGAKYKDIPNRVERAIRHAIDVCWYRVNKEFVNKIFGNTIDIDKGKPSNAQFCKTIANYLKYDLGGVTNEKI